MGTQAPAIGIDLGTTFSCVGVYRDGKVNILQNEHGSRITPSVVGFIDNTIVVGVNAMSAKPENMIYDVKRLIGRRYNENSVQADMKKWGFRVENSDDKPMIKVNHEGEEKLFHPEEISSFVLDKMKKIAEKELGMKVSKAVITVPNYFDETQRLATKHAAELAGLEVLRIVNEPVAAALAYDLDHTTENGIDVLIFDLGGGTFDVALLNIDHGIVEVIATAGNTHLGGQDFVNNMVSRLAQKIKETFSKDVGKDKDALKRLHIACERAKIRLSMEKITNVQVTGLREGIDIKEAFTRESFEKINENLFQETLDSVDQVMKDWRKAKTDIGEIVLIGGATRTPYIRDMVQKFFNGKPPCMSINPDEAVAYGATILAAKLSSVWPVDDSLLLDVTAMSLGISVKNYESNDRGDKMDKVIHRLSSLPSRKSKNYVTTADNQTVITVKAHQGEMPYTKDNRYLGEFSISGIPPAPAGEEGVTVTFDIDIDGLLTVSAVNKKTGNTGEITITRDKYHLEPADIKRMLAEAESTFTARVVLDSESMSSSAFGGLD